MKVLTLKMTMHIPEIQRVFTSEIIAPPKYIHKLNIHKRSFI